MVLILVSIDVNYDFFLVLPGSYLEFDYCYFVLQRINKGKKEKSVVLKGVSLQSGIQEISYSCDNASQVSTCCEIDEPFSL